MTDKLDKYRQADTPLPAQNTLWPLYGAGLENMGVDEKPINVPMPEIGPDELLIRHDACGLCFSDIKVIAQGQSHPRIIQDMKTSPVVLGHEVSLTVIKVGANLQGEYKPGERYTLETDIMVRGKSLAYGYWFQGGLSQYSVIGPDIMRSDAGNNLIKVQDDKGYAEIGLTEPWACVVAAYALKYRSAIKGGGVMWVVGAGDVRPFSVGAGFDKASHPARLLLSNVPAETAAPLQARANELGVEVTLVTDLDNPPVEFVDDIILLGADGDLVEKLSPRLAQFGIMCLMSQVPFDRKLNIDVGRIHYQRWVYTGSTGSDISAAYSRVPVRSSLKVDGRAWFVGAAGPMGRMHVQRAIEFSNPPAVIVCTDVSDMRLGELKESFGAQAKDKGIDMVCLNPSKPEDAAKFASYDKGGFDDIVVLAPIPPVIAEASTHLAKEGVMNVFAGVARGTMTNLDMSPTFLSDTRIIGHSASLLSDFHLVLDKTNAGELLPNRSVAAVGSLNAARDGLKAVKDATLAGKVVIYPNIRELPLTSLPELKDKLPTVYAKLNARGEWTNEAEAEFLRLMLP